MDVDRHSGCIAGGKDTHATRRMCAAPVIFHRRHQVYIYIYIYIYIYVILHLLPSHLIALHAGKRVSSPPRSKPIKHARSPLLLRRTWQCEFSPLVAVIPWVPPVGINHAPPCTSSAVWLPKPIKGPWATARAERAASRRLTGKRFSDPICRSGSATPNNKGACLITARDVESVERVCDARCAKHKQRLLLCHIHTCHVSRTYERWPSWIRTDVTGELDGRLDKFCFGEIREVSVWDRSH